MKKKIAGTGFVGLTLGALGCGDPVQPEAVRPQDLFARDVSATDSRRGEAWKMYLSAHALHAAWAPTPTSPWRPYYKPTLIAAMSIVHSAARPVSAGRSVQVDSLADQFARTVGQDRAAIFVDLPGEESVAWSAVLARYGFQPVVTFNNWPHQRGVLPLERPLGALLYYAREVDENRRVDALRPVFALEHGRIRGSGSRGAGDFDNRYFHAVSDFPSAAVLKAQGLARVYYVSPQDPAAVAEQDDLNAYFVSLANAGILFSYVGTSGGVTRLQEAKPVVRSTIFTHAETTHYASTSPYGRSYSHYHYFWSSSRSTWGGGTSSFSSGSSGFSS